VCGGGGLIEKNILMDRAVPTVFTVNKNNIDLGRRDKCCRNVGDSPRSSLPEKNV
jgi:hypothetical protein